MRLSSISLAVLATVGLRAQTPFPLTISDATGSTTVAFHQGALETSPTSGFVARADFGATAAAACDGDVLFTHACFWRVVGDARLQQFYDAGNAGDQGGVTSTTMPDRFSVRWPDAANAGVLDATWDAEVAAFGEDCGQVEHTWSLTNTSALPIVLEFYAYADVDFAVNFFNETSPNSASDRHIVQLPSSVSVLCPGFAEFRGVNPTSWEVAQWPSLETNLTSGAFVPLADAGLPLGIPNGADYSGVFGWSFSLAPGATAQAVYYLGHNVVQCDAQATVTHYGTAHGVTSLTTADLPTIGCPLRFDLTGPANAMAGLLVGSQTSGALPGCPQSILVNPFGTVGVTLDPAGLGIIDLPPTRSPVFCGLSFAFQLLALSAGEPCFPFQNSDGVQLTFGNP
ncbi:MAG: hypothetical protein KDB80_13470 [Planctomycetes bacterium]|nr:hypothetical protein [Planctomycetota bacterium]